MYVNIKTRSYKELSAPTVPTLEEESGSSLEGMDLPELTADVLPEPEQDILPSLPELSPEPAPDLSPSLPAPVLEEE